MRGPLPLSDDDFREVRAKVLARMERRRVPVWRFAFATAVVVLAVWLALPRPTVHVAQPATPRVAAGFSPPGQPLQSQFAVTIALLPPA